MLPPDSRRTRVSATAAAEEATAVAGFSPPASHPRRGIDSLAVLERPPLPRTSPLRRTPLGAIDWKALRAFALQGVRRKLRATPASTIEDLAQEVMVTLFRLSQRETLLNPEALTNTLVHRVYVDHVRRMRGPTGRLDPLPDSDSPLELPAQDPAREIGADMLQLFRFVVLEHFKQHDAPCHELATDFFAELSWASVARRLQVRHNTVIKRWSRCMVQIRELAYSQRGPVWEWAREARIV